MVDLKKIQTLDQLVPQQPAKVKQPDLGTGPSFKETLSNVGGMKPQNMIQGNPGLAKAAEGVKFSNHAIERMKTRGISYSPEDITKLQDAISRAAAKGSKDSLVLMNDSALIVSVKNNTVVTVMDKNALKENVFTNIDSTVVI
ncbi:TIGR02530 family flagellar biosynthesis protein [uncultured Bdellovibrio sp.]|uniref:TIGR02530 family flagellar biosynthesis protein n=1 Tax=Bdellovibrio sp. HCB-162 TaxID=3394234 RepID=UPI0025F6F430|nr:TIGR02530 family flagellar biosynthesis protein [uncultured Bdellovibrio sp.]